MITQEQLFEFIAQDQDLDSAGWTLETTLDSLGIDSLAQMELVFQFKKPLKGYNTMTAAFNGMLKQGIATGLLK
jgi:hypothetical protein